MTVAREQALALTRLGTKVTLASGWDGRARRLQAVAYEQELFRSWSLLRSRRIVSLLSPGLLIYLFRGARRFDVVHLHYGRDLTSVSAAVAILFANRRFVVQTHGMVMPDRRVQSRAVDRFVTRRLLQRASAVFYLTDAERVGLDAVCRGRTIKATCLPNGITVESTSDDWGLLKSGESGRTVIFCARLAKRKRVSAFLDMAKIVAAEIGDVNFVVAGPEEGDESVVEEFLERNAGRIDLKYVGALEGGEARREIARSTVYVLPSFDEPFPMTVLEAMALGTAVVITDGTGLSATLSSRGAAMVTDGSPEGLASAVIRLLTDVGLRNDRRESAFAAIRDTFGADSVALTLQAVYTSVL